MYTLEVKVRVCFNEDVLKGRKEGNLSSKSLITLDWVQKENTHTIKSEEESLRESNLTTQLQRGIFISITNHECDEK
jgi:hypothetical protein